MTAMNRRLALLTFVFAAALFVFGGRHDALAQSKLENLTIATAKGKVTFSVEVMRTDEERARGLMNRAYLPADRGMLFDFKEPQIASMWMKNTLIPLDMLFIRKDGTIAYIAENTVPKSLDTIGISEPVLAPFRRLVPNLGGMDISPIFAFIAIQVLQSFVMPPLAAYAGMPQELWRMI